MKNLAQLADDVLVKLYAEGNNGAFNVLLERYQDKVFSYILFVVRNQEVADDILRQLQEWRAA